MDAGTLATLIAAVSGAIGVAWGIWKGRKNPATAAAEAVDSGLRTMHEAMDWQAARLKKQDEKIEEQGREITDLREKVADALTRTLRCEEEKADALIREARLVERLQELESA